MLNFAFVFEIIGIASQEQSLHDYYWRATEKNSCKPRGKAVTCLTVDMIRRFALYFEDPLRWFGHITQGQ